MKRLQDRVTLRGSYSTVGFRPTPTCCSGSSGRPRKMQQTLVEFQGTEIGTYLDLPGRSWASKPAEFSPDHQPAFVKGDPPQDYLCVYPFVRTPEWYLLPAEERAALREHGGSGREFPRWSATRRARSGSAIGVDPRV